MAQYLPLPDGSSVTIREGETPQQAWERAQEMYPEAFGIRQKQEAGPEGGFLAASKAGLASLKGDVAAVAGRTGAIDEAAAEKYIQEQEEYKKKTFAPTQKGWTEAPGTKIAELLGGSIPYMAAPVAAGIGAAALPLTGTAATVAGLGATGLASYGQFVGSDLSRQMDEGKKLGETNLGYAAMAAVPQAALDLLSLKMLPGIRGIFAAAGKEIPEKVAAEIAKQGTMNVAKDYALATGKAMGAEGLTEAGQQFFERLQAGLNISDEKARDEYWDSLVGGAVLGGVLAPAGRYMERRGEAAKQQMPQQEELQKLRDDEEKRLAEERKYQETPDYAKKVVEEYDALAKQKQDLIAQIKKIEKESPTADADRAFNKGINGQIKELEKQLKPLAEDYYKSKGKLNEIERQAALAKMPVEDFMLQQMGMEVKPIPPKKEVTPEIRRGKGQLFGDEIAPPPAADTSVQEYAKGQLEAARGAGVFDLADTADYMMQDPTKADQMVKTRTPIPGLSDKDSNTVLSGVKMRLAAINKAETEKANAAMTQEMGVRKEALGATKKVEEEDPTVAAMRDWMDESRDKFQPSTDSDFNYLNGMFESAFKGQPQPIAVNENLKPLRAAPTVRKTVEELLETAATADREQRAYRTAGNRAAAIEAIKRRDAANNQLSAMSAEKPAGATTTGLKRGPAEEDTRASYARELIAARRGQQEAMAKLEDATSGVRSEQTLGRDVTGANTEEGLVKRANEAQAQFIRYALQEAAIHRRALGKPALTTDEALIAASKLHDTFSDWINRSKAKPEKTTQYDLKPVRERINRSGQTVTTYRVYDKETDGPVELTFIRQKDGTIFRIFSRYLDGKGGGSEFDTKYDKSVTSPQIIQGAFLEPEIFSLGKEGPAFTGDLNDLAKLSEAEVKHFKAIAESVRNKLAEEAPVKVQRVEAGPLKRQFAAEEAKKTAEAKGETATTLGGQLRRRKEYVSNLLDRALALKNLPEGGKFEYKDVSGRTSVVQVKGMRETLERAKEMIEDGVADTRLLDAAENQAERVLRGQDLGQVTRMGREQISEGKQVVRNVPGKEASTEIGRRGQKFVTTGKLEAAEQEKATFPKGAPVAVEANEALRELEEAIALNERVAQEKAGQKSLFPEVEEDLGYIRATPANFAKSPRMKPVWEALAQARALFKQSEQKRVAREATLKNRLRLLEQIKERMDSIRNDTKFYWANSEKWSSKAIAETFARNAPDAGKTPEEKRLLQKYVQDKKSLTIQEQVIVENALREYRERGEFQARMKEAFSLLAQGRRLYDADNQLLAFMQDTNENVRKAAQEMEASMSGLRNTVEYLKEVMKSSVLVTPAQQALIDSEIAIKRQRALYQEAVKGSIKRAREDMDEALGFLLDPVIAKTSDNLKAAEKTLAKEQADLDKIKKRFDSVLAQEDGANRTELATYELFRYEEKKGIIDDLKKQVEEQTAELQELLDERSTKYDGGVAVAQAMLDSDVKFERQYLEMLEANLASMRGESVLDNPNAYPFAYQQAKKNIDVQRQIVRAAEKRVTEFKEIAKSEQQKIEDVWQSKTLNVTAGEGIESKRRAFLPEEQKEYDALDKKVEALQTKYDTVKDKLLEATGKAKTKLQKDANKVKADLSAVVEERSALLRRTMQVSKLATAEEKQATKLREEAMAVLDRQAAAMEKDAVKEQILKTYADQLGDLLIEADAIPGPNTEEELKKIINDPKSELEDVINAQAKVSVLQSIASIEAQEEVFLEGKPSKRQKAATVLSSVGLAKGKPMRVGRMTDAKLEKLFKPTAKERALENVYFGEAEQGGADIDQYGEGKTQGSFDFGGDFNFSRGESTTGTDAKTLKAELDEAMGGDVTARGRVQIYDSVEAFEKQNPEYADKIPSDAKGFAEGKRAVLFANNIGKGHGLGVLLHEVGVHIGFRNFFNTAQFDRLVSTVKGWAARTDGSLEAQIGRKAMQRVEMAETTDEQVDDELLAYAVEEAVQAGVLQTKKGSLFGWLSSIIDAFKKALNKLGIPTSELTAGDLVNFAYGCAQLELRGTWHGTGGVFDQFDFAFMGKGEGAQAYSWGTYRAQRYGVANTYRGAEAAKQLKIAIDAWENNPEVKAWEESQRPTYNGYTSKQLIEEARNPKVPGKVGDIPIAYVRPIADALDNLQKRISEGTSFSPAQTFESFLKVMASRFSWIDKPAFTDYIAENIDYGLLKARHSDPVYKGKTWGDLHLDRSNIEDYAAGQVLWEALQIPEGTFKERLDKAIEKVEVDQQKLSKIFADSPKYVKEYNNAVAMAEAVRKLDKQYFTFNPPTASPIPKPVQASGIMMRALHLHPEDTYLLWNAAADKQPAPVDKAIKELFNDLSDEAQAKFLRLLPEKVAADGKDVYNALAGVLESDRSASLLMYEYGISGNKFLDAMSRKDGIASKKATYNYVDFSDKEQGANIVAINIAPIGKAKGILLSRKPQFTNAEFEKESATITKTVAQNKTWWDKIKANTTGLAFETQLVDRFAGFERLAKYMDKLAGTQMLYYLRTYDQRMNIVSKAVADGAPTIKEITRKDGRIERVVETSGGANIASIVNTLKDAQQYIGNGEAVNQAFTTYMAAIRAKNKGIETLNFGTDKDGKPILTEEMLDRVTALVNKNAELKSIFEAARKEYNQYNRDMLDFVASTGALSKDLVKRLVAQDDYIPFYRERKGVVELVIGNENPIRIGSIADQPYLQELVGGDTAILDFMTSSVQNTNMLVDMGMRNLATKNAVMELVDLKAATLVKKADGPDVVKFKVDGDDRYAIIATEKVKIGNKEFETGVPADILVKGMEGIPTQMPFILRAMALPAQGLRKAVTLSPLYMARQLFRDSLAAPILSGADFLPIIGAVREINSATKQVLEKRGITGGQQFKGTSEDLSKILRDISDGKPGWMKALGALEATSMELDAATRRAQYNSYIEQGLSEMEATLMSLESMNFNKRGASPSIHVANALIPFFNAQIQGLNVLYKSLAGKMPFNDQLRIREKLLMRGGMMAGATILYAMMMQDDEAYKNATPDQKYGNWFIRVPGLDEPIRVPIPFEIGYIFKAIPEALYNSMTQKHGGEEAVQAFNQILIQTIPGGTSMPTIDIGNGLKIPTLIPLPQAVKPIVETALEKSFYTGRDILSEREKKLLPEEQYRANTSEAAKLVGKAFGLSPIKMEALINGYTGTMGLAFLHAISLGVPAKETPEQAVKRLSEYPVVGGAFQPNDAGGIINSIYMRLNEDERVRSTVRTLFNEGKTQEAMALLTKRGNEYMEAELGDKFKANMNKLTQAERAIAASNLSAESKRKQLDDIRKIKIALANTTRDISDKTIRLTGFS